MSTLFFYRLTDEELASIPSGTSGEIFAKSHPRGVVLGQGKYNIFVTPVEKLALPGWSGEYYQTDNPIIHEPAINGREYLTAYLTKEETIVGEIYFVREFPRGNFYSFRDLKNVEIGRATGQTSVSLEDNFEEYKKWGFDHPTLGKCKILEIQINWIN